MSTLHVVEEVLRTTRVAMSVKEIVAAAGDRLPSKSRTPDTVVARDLSMHIKKFGEDSPFVRVSPGRYALRECLAAPVVDVLVAALKLAKPERDTRMTLAPTTAAAVNSFDSGAAPVGAAGGTSAIGAGIAGATSAAGGTSASGGAGAAGAAFPRRRETGAAEHSDNAELAG